MVLILSKENDHTTADVLKWMYKFNQEFVRVNGEDLVQQVSLSLDENQNASLQYKDQLIDLAKISAFWYRRGKINLDEHIKDNIQEDSAVEALLQKSAADEMRILEEHLHQVLTVEKSIGAYHLRSANKLSTLNTARKIGLTIPATIVTQHKTQLTAFLQKHKAIITKPIYETPIGKIYGNSLWVYTSEINDADLANIPDTFFPSLFQERIAKKYELRIFFLNGQCYGTAIFSQLGEEASADLRNYNQHRPNRRVPFNVPQAIEEKLIALMEQLKLNCGSIDLIVTPENEFIFLEVNPIGQFGYTSSVGNFKLEKEIAKYLSQ